MHEVLTVEGMTCEHCKMAVTNAVGALEGVSNVQVSLQDKRVSFDHDERLPSLERVKQAVQEQGYRVV